MGIEPTCGAAADKCAVSDHSRAIKNQQPDREQQRNLCDATHLQSDWNHKEEQRRNLELRENGSVGDKDGSNPATGSAKDSLAWHQEEVAEFAREDAKKVEKQKLTRADDRFDVASEEVEHDDVADEVPGVAVEERCGKELPGV